MAGAADLRAHLAAANEVTHAVISAPWIPSPDLQRLIADYNEVQFAVDCHSNVGILQADSNGVRLFGEGVEIERGSYNFRMAGNSRKFTDWVRVAFGVRCAICRTFTTWTIRFISIGPDFQGWHTADRSVRGYSSAEESHVGRGRGAGDLTRAWHRSGAVDQLRPRRRRCRHPPRDQGDVHNYAPWAGN